MNRSEVDSSSITSISQVNEDEASSAFRAWIAMIRFKDDADAAFKRMDKDGTGNLNREELKPALVELNDGVEVHLPALKRLLQNQNNLRRIGYFRRHLAEKMSAERCKRVDIL